MMLSQSFLIDADRDQHLLKELMAGIDPLCDLFSAFRKSDVSVQIHLHITFCAEFLHCDTDTGLGIIHVIDNVDRSYISVSLTQDQYVFQIILCGLMTFFHVAPPYKENSKTIAPYAGRSNSIY